jgi:Protein of unknown function (DUF1254)
MADSSLKRANAIARMSLSRLPARALFATFTLCALGGAHAAPPDRSIVVTPDNFPRAESDLFFSGVVKDGGFGKFMHRREPTPPGKQTIIRMNRDTLYSAAVFDLDAGPVTITLPDPGKRFLSNTRSTTAPRIAVTRPSNRPSRKIDASSRWRSVRPFARRQTLAQCDPAARR